MTVEIPVVRAIIKNATKKLTVDVKFYLYGHPVGTEDKKFSPFSVVPVDSPEYTDDGSPAFITVDSLKFTYKGTVSNEVVGVVNAVYRSRHTDGLKELKTWRDENDRTVLHHVAMVCPPDSPLLSFLIDVVGIDPNHEDDLGLTADEYSMECCSTKPPQNS